MSKSCINDRLLNALLDGELADHEADRLQRHMAACNACRLRWEALKETDTILKALPQIDPSADFDRTFWMKIDHLEQQRERRNWWRYVLSGWRPVALGALTAALVAVMVYTTRMDHGLSPEEIFIAENVDLLKEFELIDQLDLLEHWEVIERMQEQT